jgi:transcriptional regulator with XRE-family HTH domain
MSLFSENIRNLRMQNKVSQDKIAESLHITRGRFVKYENGSSEPPYDILKKMALYFHVSIDLLLSVDVRKIPLDELLKLDDNRILLPITVDKNGDNFIEIIPHKAKAGYLNGYADPEFIENLRHISLPFLGPGKYRAFPVEGDSMPPHKDGSFIVGRYVEKFGDVLDGKTYILLTRDQGIVYKRLNKNGKNALMAQSDNNFYPSYPVKVSDILEIWEYASSIATEEFKPDAIDTDNLSDIVRELRRDILEIKNKFH